MRWACYPVCSDCKGMSQKKLHLDEFVHSALKNRTVLGARCHMTPNEEHWIVWKSGPVMHKATRIDPIKSFDLVLVVDTILDLKTAKLCSCKLT